MNDFVRQKTNNHIYSQSLFHANLHQLCCIRGPKPAKHHHASTSIQPTFPHAPANATCCAFACFSKEMAIRAAVTVSGTPRHVRHLEGDTGKHNGKAFPMTNVQGKQVRSQCWVSSLTVNTRFTLKCIDSYMETNALEGSQPWARRGVLQRGSIDTCSITAGINGTVASVLLRHRKSS